ncbi:MAG: GntR family transcriptional regulator [Bilophila wadsworthia]
MQQLNKPTYSEQVVNLIRQRIRNGKLRSGDRISEASIAEECGISRAPVREALYQLETEGFLIPIEAGQMRNPAHGRRSIRHRYELCASRRGPPPLM